jgi:MFS family permease
MSSTQLLPPFPQAESELEPTESTALLADLEIAPVAVIKLADDATIFNPLSTTPVAQDPDERSLLKSQILLLCTVRLYEGVAFFTIFPFINQMIYETGGVKKTDVGFYLGLIESSWSITQMLAMIPWGKLADNPRVGRKPVLVVSLIGEATATALFGVSSTIGQMIFFRCLAGVFGGMVVTVRTMIVENSSPKTQPQAFSWFAFAGNLGVLLGPMIGGGLVDPAREYPHIFGSVRFFQDHPYALSTFGAGFVGFMVATICLLFVKETLKPDKIEPLLPTTPSSADVQPIPEPMSVSSLLKSPGVAIAIFIQAHIMLLSFSYGAVIPVFWFTPISLSGFGFSPKQISLFLVLIGVCQANWMLILFPRLQHRFGTVGVIKACAWAYPIFVSVGHLDILCPIIQCVFPKSQALMNSQYASFPIFNTLLRHNHTTAFWTIAPVSAALFSGVAMSFTAIQLVINNVNPHPSTLGTLNAVALAVISGVRAFSPAMFASIFAIGVRNQTLGGHLAWVLMIILAVAFTVDSHYLPVNAEGEAERDKDTDVESE